MTSRFISKTPKCEIIVATKWAVDELLSMNTNNRNIRKSHVEYLREEVNRGAFVLTNQGVGVDVDGVVVDGQHRLLALKAAEYPEVQLLVAYGLPREARAAIDIGVKRTVTDIMRFAFERPEATSAMVSIARAWGNYAIVGGLYVPRIPPNQVAEWYMLLAPSMEKVLRIPQATKFPAPVLAAICHRLHAKPHDEARVLSFLDMLINGVGLAKDSPVLLLRNWLISKTGEGSSAIQRERFDKTANALYLHLENRSIAKLYQKTDAAKLLAEAA